MKNPFPTFGTLCCGLWLLTVTGNARTQSMVPVLPLKVGAVMHMQQSKKADVSWRNQVTWSDWMPRDWTLVNVQEQSQVYSHTYLWWFDAKSFTHAPLRSDKSSTVLAQRGQRPEAPLVPGQRWKASITYEVPPANWCNDLKTTVSGDYEVHEPEPYTLRIDEQELTLQVHPVVRKGYWERCYTGRQVHRYLWSPELGVLLANELLTYDPAGRLHTDSFSVRVKHIERRDHHE